LAGGADFSPARASAGERQSTVVASKMPAAGKRRASEEQGSEYELMQARLSSPLLGW
jgi:hypothetical protein